jgi:ribose-phosphate pyrophosphokinase
MKIIAGNTNRPLAEAVASHLGVGLTKAVIRRFADMEVFVEILENVRGEDVFIIQPTCYPANDSLMELLITIDACRRGSARDPLLWVCAPGPENGSPHAHFGQAGG